MDISSWLKQATRKLRDIGIDSSRLDAELILANTLRASRTHLHAHLDDEIDPRRIDIADARLELRLERVPLAYILGYKEFYGRKFKVTPSVLIPRPESEDMIEILLSLTSSELQPKTLVDIGTGSGALGITAKLERPELSVILTDVSKKALEVAEENAKSLGATVNTREQDLLFGQIEKVDYILANLPYVDRTWATSPEVKHEPARALFAGDGGLEFINTLLDQAPNYLKQNGVILIEADPEQHLRIIDISNSANLELIEQKNYILAFRLKGR